MSHENTIPISWLFEKVNIPTVFEELKQLPLPESFRERYLQSITECASEMIEGDELWKFSNSVESWEGKCGVSGLAILRDGKIYLSKCISMN